MKLILIRGNSGSGKTSLANLLHEGIPHSRLIHQDVIRRDILNTHDDLVVQELIIAMLEVMKKQEQPIILEGIFRKDKYQKLFDYLFITMILALKKHSKDIKHVMKKKNLMTKQ